MGGELTTVIVAESVEVYWPSLTVTVARYVPTTSVTNDGDAEEGDESVAALPVGLESDQV